MRFYSYNYLLEQIARFDWWGAAFTIFLIICLIVTIFKYHQGQKETKFRELAIILGLGIVVVISIKITQYRVTQANDNHYRQAIHFIEIVSKDLNTDKENIYINTSASIDGALVKITDITDDVKKIKQSIDNGTFKESFLPEEKEYIVK